MSLLDASVVEYPLCTRPLSELAVMHVAELEPRRHHQGRYLPVKITSAASNLAEVAAVDEHDEMVTLLVPLLCPPASPLFRMPANSVFFVKEPYVFEPSNDGGPLRVVVGYVSNIVWAADLIDYLPYCWRWEYSFPGKTAEELIMQAHNAFKSRRYHDAVLMYVTFNDRSRYSSLLISVSATRQPFPRRNRPDISISFEYIAL
jgi:hypothetical protein